MAISACLCLFCNEPILANEAVIVGVDVAGYPERLPVNILAHRGCENQARDIIAHELERKAQKAQAR